MRHDWTPLKVLSSGSTPWRRKFAAVQRLGGLDFAQIKADIAVLAAQFPAFEQRSGKRFLGLETRMGNLETRMGNVETVQGEHTKLLEEILRRLPQRA